MKTNLITNCLDVKESCDEDIVVFCPFCLFINEIERDYANVPMIWCEACGCRAVLDLRNPVLIQKDFKLKNEPLIDFSENRSLNCGTTYEYINSNLNFLFEVSLFYIKRISTKDFYMFSNTDGKKYDESDSIIFLKFKKCLENREAYNYFFLSEILKKIEIYADFMKILFGEKAEIVIDKLNKEKEVFSHLQNDVDTFSKDKNNETLKWDLINYKEHINSHKCFKDLKIGFSLQDFFKLRERSEFEEGVFNFFVSTNSFDIENPQTKYPEYLDTSHDGIIIYFEYYDPVEKKMHIGKYSGD